jgi:PAS domain S-box-containing protein
MNMSQNTILFITSLYAFVLYVVGGVISILIFQPYNHQFILWLPLGISIGFIYHYGNKVLAGISVAAVLTYFYTLLLHKGLASLNYLDVTFTFIAALGETVLAILLISVIRKFKINSPTNKGFSKLNLTSLIVLATAIVVALFQGLMLYTIKELVNPLELTAILLSNFLVISISLTLFITLQEYSLNLKNTKNAAKISGTLIIGLIIIFYPFTKPFVNIGAVPFYMMIILWAIFASLNLNLFLSTALAGLVLIGSTFSISTIISENQPATLITHLVIAGIAIYLIQFLNRKFTEKTLNEGKYGLTLHSLETEIERQTKEYKKITNQLFVEIEKRGKAERELTQSKKLLSEAQEYSGIATWEYSLATKRFRWIAYNDKSPLLDFNLENETLKTLTARLHPDDLNVLRVINRTKPNASNDFEVEVRLKNSNEEFKYFLMRGRSIVERGTVARVVGLVMDINERKQFEKELLEKEQKYRALFDSNIDPVCVIDPQTYIIYDVNPAFESVYGYKRAEIVDKSYVILSAQPEETKSAIAFGKQKGYYRVLQRTHRKKNGEEFNIEANLMSYVVNGKEMLFIITHDITQRKKSENLIAEREQKFRTFFESDLIGMAEISISKEFLTYNDKLTKMLGYSQDDMRFKNWDEVTFAEDLTEESRLFNKVLTHSIDGYSIEKRFVTKDNSIIYCEVSLKSIKTSQGNISHLIVLIDDITDRKIAEKELKESRAQLSQAQSVAKLGSVRFYPDQSNILLSEEAYEILGYGKARPLLTRKNLFDLILPGSVNDLTQSIKKLEQAENVRDEFELALISNIGEVKYILVNFGLTILPSKEVKEVLITMADITRIKMAEMALQEANALKDQLFSIISHDLRSPISSMSQLTEMLKNSWKTYDEETNISIIKTLESTSIETYKLLENLLEWANNQRFDKFKPVQTNLIPLIEEVAKLKAVVANSKEISLVKNLLPEAIVIVDVEMVKTILRNLLTNSIKFTPKRGSITIEVKDVGDNFSVSVIDNGIGINEKDQKLLFENHESITTPGTDNEKGTGLGLKLVKKFVDKNHGEISVESSPGKGSKFTFSLPKVKIHS